MFFFKRVFYYLLLAILLLFSENIKSQQLSQKTVYDVYENILSAIGNNNPRPPKLVIKSTERNPASYNPKKKNIIIEEKVLRICYSFGLDSLNALSYILAHELGHHYRNHGWMAEYASLEFSNTLDSYNKTPEQREVYEIESDIYGGFYAHIAGYDALRVADVFLDSIYQSYSLPHDLKNYPSLEERKAIINKNRSDFKILKNIFDFANILMSIGKYNYAQELYQYIINNEFSSREIYNNLGLCYVYEALDLNLEAEFFNLLIPFNLDVSTRLESAELSRSLFSPKTKAIELFKLAQEQFEIAISLDRDYLTVKENLFFTEIALNFLDDKVISTDVNSLLSSTNSCKNCINGQLLVSQNKLNKAKRVFKDGSSSCLFCEINTDFKKKKTLKEFANDDNKTIFNTELVNGVDMYCSDFRESNCDDYYKLSLSKICKSKINGINVFKLKRRLKGITSCISVQEIASNNIDYKNNLDIYVGDDVSEILDNHSDIRLVKTSKKEYITVVSEKLTFLIINGKVNKWFLFDDNY